MNDGAIPFLEQDPLVASPHVQKPIGALFFQKCDKIAPIVTHNSSD